MQEFWRGAGRALGVVVGFLPIGMSLGAIAIQTKLSSAVTIFMSMWLYAGASQFALVEAAKQQLPWLSILITVLIINLRHIAMSLSAQSVYGHFPRWQRWVLAAGLIDETFALEMTEEARSFPYYLGMHVCCWLSWVGATAIGCQLGLLLPERWLQFALPALFLCLLLANVRRQGRGIWAVVAIALALVLMLQSFGSTGILLAILGVAIAASVLLRPQASTQP
ncbi:AzlC family ABC transporter permease [Leptolyngbya sp. AN02str]|uniref:AzlC family ABC transporter permease n=1 Tax=Leptolyngbya sp. AN02str TaxID=3423363 RepID=UPI003D3107EB